MRPYFPSPLNSATALCVALAILLTKVALAESICADEALSPCKPFSAPQLLSGDEALEDELKAATENSTFFLLVFSSEEDSLESVHFQFDKAAARFPSTPFFKIDGVSFPRNNFRFMVFGLPSIVHIVNASHGSTYSADPSDDALLTRWMGRVGFESPSAEPSASFERSPIPRTPSRRVELPRFLAYICAAYALFHTAYSLSRESLKAWHWLRS